MRGSTEDVVFHPGYYRVRAPQGDFAGSASTSSAEYDVTSSSTSAQPPPAEAASARVLLLTVASLLQQAQGMFSAAMSAQWPQEAKRPRLSMTTGSCSLPRRPSRERSAGARLSACRMGARSVSRTPAHTGVRRGSTPRCVGRGRLLPRNVRRLWARTRRTCVCTLMLTRTHALQPPAWPLALCIAAAAVAPRCGATFELSSASRGPVRRPCAGVVPSRRHLRSWVGGLLARRDRVQQNCCTGSAGDFPF